ncbi:MAG: alginate export family protein [Planctomycetes bacterium]|nr:alginate export family protein [Planctomycetota bacterium]
MSARWSIGAAIFVLLAAGGARAQQGGSPPTAAELRAELDALERRLREVERREAAGGDDPLAPPPPLPADDGDEAAPADPEKKEPERIVLQLPRSMKLEVRGHLRLRGETRHPADYRIPGTFGRPATDGRGSGDDFILQRAWIGLDFTVTEHLRAVFAIQDARLWGDHPVGQDAAETFIREAFIEGRRLFDQPLTVRAGRNLVPHLGDGRLMHSLDPWAGVPRIWDAVQVTYDPQGWWFSAFASNLREAGIQTPRGSDNDDFWLVGVYASCRLIEKHELDGYLFYRNLSDRVFASEARPGRPSRLGEREDFTTGMRLKGELGPVGYSGEAVYQWGDQAGDDVRAWAAASKAWYTYDLGEGRKVRLGGEYAFASGDRDPTDGKNQTFDPIFPFGHFYHGHMDLFSWRNMHAVSAQLAVFPLAWLSLHADGHVFWLDSRRDAWYSAAKAPLRRDPSGRAGSHVGTELDLYVQMRLWEERFFLWAGYSHFWTGEYVRATGFSKDMDWAFLHLELNF